MSFKITIDIALEQNSLVSTKRNGKAFVQRDADLGEPHWLTLTNDPSKNRNDEYASIKNVAFLVDRQNEMVIGGKSSSADLKAASDCKLRRFTVAPKAKYPL